MENIIIFNDIFKYKIINVKEGGMGNVLILNRISKAHEFDLIHQKMMAAKTYKENLLENKKIFEREISIWLNFDDYVFQNKNYHSGEGT